jgi:hypothetical protein
MIGTHAVLKLDGHQIVCNSGSTGCNAGTGVLLSAANTTIQGPGLIRAFFTGVAGAGGTGTLAKRLIVEGVGITSGKGISGVITVDSNQVSNFGIGINYAGFSGGTTTTPDVIDNLVTQCREGIRLDNSWTVNTYPRFYHNRLVANSFGLSLTPLSYFNALTGCADGCGVSEHNVITYNTTADLYDETYSNLDMTRNVCFHSWSGTCLNNGAECRVDSDCPASPPPQTCSVLTWAGPCSTSPILPSWTTFQP